MENHESGYVYGAKERTVKNQVQQVVMENAGIPYGVWWAAYGRLANWASDSESYKFVIIQHDRFEGDLMAIYWKSEESQSAGDRPNFVMGAVYNESTKTYSFHS